MISTSRHSFARRQIDRKSKFKFTTKGRLILLGLPFALCARAACFYLGVKVSDEPEGEIVRAG